MPVESNNDKICGYILYILVLKLVFPVINLYYILKSLLESKIKIRSHSISVNNYSRVEFLILCRCINILIRKIKEKGGDDELKL